LFGTVYEDSQVLAVHTKIAADLVFVTLFEKQGLNQAAVPVGKFPHDAAHLLLHLVQREDITNCQSWIGNVEFVVGSELTARRTIVLAHDVIANGVDESAKPLRMIDISVSEDAQDASEGLLPDVFDIFARVKAFARLEPNQLSKIRKEVLLRVDIARTKPIHIAGIELLKLHWHDCFLPRKRPSELAFFPVYL